MSFFPRAFVASEPSFTPFFRLIDDFDTIAKSTGGNRRHCRSHMQTFQPRFDVKEVADAYELVGELPGIEQKDVAIEFTDAQTLSIRGRTERSHTSGTPPSNAVEDAKSPDTITEGGEQQNSHKATVEDDDAFEHIDAPSATPEQKTSTSEQKPQQQQEQPKVWVSERRVGEFARSFSFSARVDQDAVKASMKNGILSILVPKAKKHEAIRIEIS